MSVVSYCLYPDAAGRRILAFVNIQSSFGCCLRCYKWGRFRVIYVNVSALEYIYFVLCHFFTLLRHSYLSKPIKKLYYESD